MNQYNFIKLKCFLVNMIIAVACFVFGGAILLGVVSEMTTSYIASSRYAYIAAIITCTVILLAGVLFLIQGFFYDRLLMRNLTASEVKQLKMELTQQVTALSNGYAIVTPDFMLFYTGKIIRPVVLMKKDQLIAAFDVTVPDNKAGIYEHILELYDRNFKLCSCHMKGAAAVDGPKVYEVICSQTPWIFKDDEATFKHLGFVKEKKRRQLSALDKRKYDFLHSEDIQAKVERAVDSVTQETQVKTSETLNKILTASQENLQGSALEEIPQITPAKEAPKAVVTEASSSKQNSEEAPQTVMKESLVDEAIQMPEVETPARVTNEKN